MAEHNRVKINGETFIIQWDESETSKSFQKELPRSFTMKELNGNEKYVYMNHSFPSRPRAVKQIHKGDVMLYVDKCLVIFYKDFTTTYSYTRLGCLQNADALDQVADQKEITAQFL